MTTANTVGGMDSDTPQRDLVVVYVPDEPAGPAILLGIVVSALVALAVVVAVVWHLVA